MTHSREVLSGITTMDFSPLSPSLGKDFKSVPGLGVYLSVKTHVVATVVLEGTNIHQLRNLSRRKAFKDRVEDFPQSHRSVTWERCSWRPRGAIERLHGYILG